MASNGVEWLRWASMEAQEGTDVEVPLVPQPNQRTGAVCLTDSRLPGVFVVPVMIETLVTLVLWCSVVTPSGAPRPKVRQ